MITKFWLIESRAGLPALPCCGTESRRARRISKYLLAAFALGLLAACDPIKDEADFDVTRLSSDQLLARATFEQFSAVKAEDGSITYNPDPTGNYIKYCIPSVSGIQIYYLKPDGSEFVLASGSGSGMFNFTPSRGSEPVQTVYFRYINQDGETVEANKEFTLTVASDLAPEMKLLASNEGSKIWKWNPNAPDGQFWGNMGSDGNQSGVDFALNGNGKWWGVVSDEEFAGQINHTPDGQAHGDESLDATMKITEDGMIYCYDAGGAEIRKGKFEVKNYDPTYSQSVAYCGILHTDPGTILFPYEINSGGNMPTDFEIAYLSAGRLVLVYPDKGKWEEDWSEGTFWQFCSSTDIGGILTDYSSATWEWDDDNGQCWGNGGYSSFVYGGAGSISSNSWWGVPSTSLEEQITNYGYGFADGPGATMTFNDDGSMTKSSGGKGTFAYDASNISDLGGYNEGKTFGRLTTTGDGILFNQRINAGEHGDLPATISEFDIVYISEDNLVLIAPSSFKSSGGESWEEGTFWRFKKVK